MTSESAPGTLTVPDVRPPAEPVSVGVLGAVSAYLDAVARTIHERLGNIAGVAVTMAADNGGPVTVGASTELARAADELQYGIGRGPCLDVLAGGAGLYVPDLANAIAQWGPYGPQAAALGVRSCLSVPVLLDDRVVAVFKIYAYDVDGLDAGQRKLGLDVGLEVARGIGLAQLLASTTAELDDRVQAMDSRRTIDLAVGVLMERLHCDPDFSFALLRRYSQTRNMKVRDVAEEIVALTLQPGPAGGTAPMNARPGTGRVVEVTRPADSAPFRPRGARPAL